jgi:hypothetical protein
MGHVWTAPAVQEENRTSQRAGRVQPCIRPLNAAAVAAGPDVIRGSGPNQKHAFSSRMAHVAGLPDRRSRPFASMSSSPLQFFDALTQLNSHQPAPCHAAANQADRQVLPLIISAQAMRAILLASATATTLNGRRVRSRVTQGYRVRQLRVGVFGGDAVAYGGAKRTDHT